MFNEIMPSDIFSVNFVIIQNIYQDPSIRKLFVSIITILWTVYSYRLKSAKIELVPAIFQFMNIRPFMGA